MTATVPVSGTYDGAVPQSDPNTVIGKVFMVFEAFRGSVAPIGVSELTRRTGLSKSTVFRLINELVDVGALVRVGDGYRIGLRLFELGSLHYPQIMRDAMQPFFEDLHLATGLAVISGVLDGSDVVFLEYYAPRRRGLRPGDAGGDHRAGPRQRLREDHAGGPAERRGSTSCWTARCRPSPSTR